MPQAPLPDTIPLRVLVCGGSAARLLFAAGDADDGSPWRRFDRAGRPVLLAEAGDTDAGLARAAVLAPFCDAVLLVVGEGQPAPLARRQASVARMAGVGHLVVLRDAPGGDEEQDLADSLRFPAHHDIPLGEGPDGTTALCALFESLSPGAPPADGPFRMPVETLADGGSGTALTGTIVSGRVRPGDALVAAGSGRGAAVVSIHAGGLDCAQGSAGETVTLHLDRATGAEPGEVLAAAGDRPESCDQFAARILWLDAEPLLPGRPYGLRIGRREVVGSVTRIKHRIADPSAAPLAAGLLRAGDQGRVNLSLAEPVVFETFERSRALGSFTLTDRASGRTVAAGTIDFALRRAANIHRQAVDVTKAARAAAKAQRPALLWFTGLSGAGKSTIANIVERRLFALGHHTYLLDGDNVRHGLNRDLGFTAQDRVENIRRVAETAKLMVDAGLITLASFISPFRAERQLARDLLAAGEFIEVFVDAPLSVAERRDPKGLYAQARAGRIPNFTGIDSPYEAPEAPELHLRTDSRSAEDLADDVVEHLRAAGFLAPGAG